MNYIVLTFKWQKCTAETAWYMNQNALSSDTPWRSMPSTYSKLRIKVFTSPFVASCNCRTMLFSCLEIPNILTIWLWPVLYLSSLQRLYTSRMMYLRLSCKETIVSQKGKERRLHECDSILDHLNNFHLPRKSHVLWTNISEQSNRQQGCSSSPPYRLPHSYPAPEGISALK